MAQHPLVSIVIPSYNHGAFLAEAINSVRQIGYPNYEIIVVDDGSTDEHSRAIASSYADDEDCTVILQENKGVAASRNVAIRAAKGKYVIPLDADNKLLAPYFEQGVDLLEHNPSIGVVHGDALIIGERKGSWKNHTLKLEEIVFENYIDNCAIFRKSCWEKVGGYDENAPFHTREDWFFWLSLLEHGYEFYHLASYCFEYRFLSNSKVRSRASSMKNRLIISEYIYPTQERLIHKFRQSGAIDAATANKLLGKLRSQLAYYHLGFGNVATGYTYWAKSWVYPQDWIKYLKLAVSWPLKRLKATL